VAQLFSLSMTGMRAFYLVSLLAVCCTLSCRRPEVQFHKADALSNAEKQGAAAVHTELARWQPDSTALWDKQGVLRHVCLKTDGGSIVWPYLVVVFDGQGRVVEGNIIDGPSGAWPKTVVSVSPLLVAFTGGALGADTRTVGVHYSPEAGMRAVKLWETERRSDSTNHEQFAKMWRDLDAAVIVSPR
jgi:hypothetical protein